ncbi:MAG: hypothetical protein FIB07_02095 [Candidatus Methanoperedens sp.]|nr:hypothetical protein [Candidatus Methanoperedens sp.]
MLDNIIKVLKNKSYLAVALISIAVMICIYAVFTNLTMGTQINPGNGFLTIVMAVLSGIYQTMFIYNQREMGFKKHEKTGIAGMFIGFFTSACPVCTPLLVSLLGISAPLAFILSKNLWLEIASIMLLLFALFKLSESMNKCSLGRCE